MQNNDDFKDLFDNAPCGYLVLDDRSRIVLVNRTLRGWLGFDTADIIGKNFPDLMPIAGRMFFETHFSPLLRMQGFFHEVALDFLCRDGTRLPVLANATQTADVEGRGTKTRIAIFQATSRRKYERELADANRAGSEARKEIEGLVAALTETALHREEFIAILGHDLRNPLASIGSGMRILSKEDLSTRARQMVSLIEGSVSRMSGLIGDVLDLTRGRIGGGFSLNRRAEEGLASHLEQVVGELAGSSERVIDTAFALEEPIYVDAARVAQLVSNLLGNAITHGASDQPISLEARTEEGALVLTVSNGGDSIPEEAMQRLFQPFFRGGTSEGRSEQGLGLGLYIASEIAKAHGGTLTVTSSSERTAFEFRMPNGSDDTR